MPNKQTKKISNVKDLGVSNSSGPHALKTAGKKLENATTSVVKKVVQIKKKQINRSSNVDISKGVARMKRGELLNHAKKILNLGNFRNL